MPESKKGVGDDPLNPEVLTEKLKGSGRAYRAEFLQLESRIRHCLAEGHTLRNVFDELRASGLVSFSYETFRRYVRGKTSWFSTDAASTRMSSSRREASDNSEPSTRFEPAAVRDADQSRVGTAQINALWNRLANPNAAKGPYVFGAENDEQDDRDQDEE